MTLTEITELLNLRLGPGWKSEFVQHPLNTGLDLYIETKIKRDDIQYMEQEKVPAYLAQCVYNVLNNLNFVNELKAQHNNEVAIMLEDIKLKDQEIERLKEYETYYRLEKEMRRESKSK